MAGEKRKREKDFSAKSSKRPTTSPAASASVTVTLVEGDECAPIIVSTPGVSVNSSISLKAYSRKRQKALHGGAGSISSEELLLHSSEHPTIDYNGREEEAGGTDNLLKHYIGVYDPATGKLELMEARKMAVRGIVRAQQAAPESLLERGGGSDMRALRNDLGQTFGTKKAKKAIVSLTENAISANPAPRLAAGEMPRKLDSTTKAILATMADATAGISTRAQLTAAADDAKPRPKANLAAENVNEVYTVESLIGLDVMKSIPVKDWQDNIKSNQEVISKSRYVANRINKTATDVQKLKVLRYLECLVNFFNSCKPRRSSRQVPKKDELRAAMSEFPESIVSSVVRKFSTSGELSKFQVDLITTNICALSLLVDNYEVDLLDLREDLKLEAKALATYYSEIGARIGPIGAVEAKRLGLDRAAIMNRKIAKLKLPLEFPKARFARK